jgi:hypothetical protein
VTGRDLYRRRDGPEFLDRLQDELERMSDYERLLRLLRVLTKFASLFCMAGD